MIKKHCKGFTLIEILVATAILSLIMVMFSQFIGVVNRTIQKSQRPLSALEQARVVLDLMSRDFSKILIRRDMSYLFKGGNFYGDNSEEFFRFYSDQKSGTSATNAKDRRGISIIGYRMSPHPSDLNKSALFRGSDTVSWSEKSFYGLISQASGEYFTKSLLSFQEENWSLIGRSVLGVGVDYLYRYSRPFAENALKEEFELQGRYSFRAPQKLRYRSENSEQNADPFRVSAVRVTLLVMNEDVLNLLSPQDLESLRKAIQIRSLNRLSRDCWQQLIFEQIKATKGKTFWSEIKICTRVIPLPLFFADEILDENPYP